MIKNISQYHLDYSKFNKLDLKTEEQEFLFKQLNLTILKSINDGKDFIFKYNNLNIIKAFSLDLDSLVGYNFVDLFPYAKEKICPLFDSLLRSKDKKFLYINFYENDELVNFFEMELFSYNDEICIIFNERTDFSYNLKNNDSCLDQKELDMICCYGRCAKGIKTCSLFSRFYGKVPLDS